MKKLLSLLFFLPFLGAAQDSTKFWHISENELKVATCEFLAGYVKSWSDVITYHPVQLFQRFPNLNRRFWDIREQQEPGFLNTEWDADHVLKAELLTCHLAAITVKLGEGKLTIGRIAKSLLLNYLSFKGGFLVGWVYVHHNSL